VSLRVLDMAGRRVGEVPSQHWAAGVWSVAWNGKNPSGQSLAAGVYFVEMLVNGQRVGQSRMALIR
jgi:flagellar hook assembly protein FlgD